MAKRLAFTILVTVLGASALLTACADDDDRIDDVTGGEAGNGAGADTGGSSSGGTSAGQGGSLPAGGEMQGGQSQGGAGAAGDAGMTGEGGDTTVGGGGAAAGDGGGAGNPAVAYACGNTSISRKLCSALVAAQCDDLPACAGEPPPDPCCTDCVAPVCPDCVALADMERQTFAECPACLAEYDRHLHCGIDPFEAGNLSEGVECYDGFGAAVHDGNCYPLFESAQTCLGYIVDNPCPDSWPMP